MTYAQTIETTIPFMGFYCSAYDALMDNWLEQQCDWIAERTGKPVSEVADLLWLRADWQPVRESIAQAHTQGVADWLSDIIGAPSGLKFRAMTSPRYYNFETDRVICTVPMDTVRALRSLAGDNLASMARERFTSRDGFASFYPADIAEWPEDMAEWDCNHVGTLIQSLWGERIEWEIFESIAENDYKHCERAISAETWRELEGNGNDG